MDSKLTSLARANGMSFAELYGIIDSYFRQYDDPNVGYNAAKMYLQILTYDDRLIGQVIDEYLEIKRDSLGI